MDELRIVAPFHNSSGYSKLARAALRTATLAGFKVQAVEADYREKHTTYDIRRVTKRLYEQWSRKYPPNILQRTEVDKALKTRVRPEAPTLLIQFPEQVGGWQEFSQGPRLAWTMIESDRITKESWLKGLFGADLLIAPSRYVWQTFKTSVPEIRLEFLPLPVDERLMEGWRTVEIDTPKQFLFFSVFNTRERKHWRIMLQAFAEEFKSEENVGLVVKPSLHIGDVIELAGWLNEPRTPRHITVLREWLSDDTLAAWYHRCNCYVLPSCEGFGLPFVEAALCGLPSIALDDGGAADVVNTETGWRIESERRQVIGNLPHVYDSTHKFACPKDIYAIRRAFRLAYESSENKGAVAQRKAQEYTPAALVPRFRQVVERAAESFKTRTRMWNLPILPQWALMVGDGFGDAMACVGNAQEVLKGAPQATIGVLHYGSSRSVEEFLLEQPIVREVRQIVPENEEVRAEVSNEVGGYYAYPAQRWLPLLLKDAPEINAEMVAMTQVHWPWGTWPVYRPSGLRLSDEAESWATAKKAEIGEFVMVQPFSTNSVGFNEHWPYWVQLLRWLLQATESTHRLVFCGMHKIPGLGGENVVDLIGETPSMQHVLALSDRAKGCITTCNALGVWTACRGIPALVIANQAIARKDQYWYRWQDVKPNRLMPLESSLPDVVKAAERFLEGLSK